VSTAHAERPERWRVDVGRSSVVDCTFAGERTRPWTENGMDRDASPELELQEVLFVGEISHPLPEMGDLGGPSAVVLVPVALDKGAVLVVDNQRIDLATAAPDTPQRQPVGLDDTH
jgi:hypothetical protein